MIKTRLVGALPGHDDAVTKSDRAGAALLRHVSPFLDKPGKFGLRQFILEKISQEE